MCNVCIIYVCIINGIVYFDRWFLNLYLVGIVVWFVYVDGLGVLISNRRLVMFYLIYLCCSDFFVLMCFMMCDFDCGFWLLFCVVFLVVNVW